MSLDDKTLRDVFISISERFIQIIYKYDKWE